MAVNDIMQVTVEQTLHGQTCLNVFHYRIDEQGDGGAAALLTRFGTVVIPLLKACQSDELSHVRLIGQKIWPLPPQVPAINTTFAGAGGVAGNSLPTEVTAVVTKRTDFAGRKYRGRVFVAGVPVASESDSRLAAGVLATWAAFANIVWQPLVQDGTTFVAILWHRATKTYDPIRSNTEVRTILRSQRRRQVGKGQ